MPSRRSPWLFRPSLLVGMAAVLLHLPTAHAQRVASVVGQVQAIWPDDDRLARFQSYLSRRFADTPGPADFRLRETWLIVSANAPQASPSSRREFKVRAPSDWALTVGDRVEVLAMDDNRVRRYAELSAVTRVLCRRAEADFEACAQRHPMAVRDFAALPELKPPTVVAPTVAPVGAAPGSKAAR